VVSPVSARSKCGARHRLTSVLRLNPLSMWASKNELPSAERSLTDQARSPIPHIPRAESSSRTLRRCREVLKTGLAHGSLAPQGHGFPSGPFGRHPGVRFNDKRFPNQDLLVHLSSITPHHGAPIVYKRPTRVSSESRYATRNGTHPTGLQTVY